MALYRNWPEICKIGRLSNLLMLVLSTVPLKKEGDVLTGLYVGFPQCFSETPIAGPFPLSIIRQLAQERADNECRRSGQAIALNGADYPDNYDVLDDLDVPSILFEVLKDEQTAPCMGWPKFPIFWEEAKKLKQGDLFTWQGQQLVILEVNFNEKAEEVRVAAAPAESILLDL